MKTLMSIKEQNEWLLSNWQNNSFSHKWSCRGMGNSRIINSAGEQLAHATGSGYDRFGTALGDAINSIFPNEVLTLARRECKGKRNASRCGSVLFYGLFLNKKENTVYIEGGCGEREVIRILNKIGFSLDYCGDSGGTNSGQVFYRLIPLTKLDRKHLPKKNGD